MEREGRGGRQAGTTLKGKCCAVLKKSVREDLPAKIIWPS
jgi:hypothetical protein